MPIYGNNIFGGDSSNNANNIGDLTTLMHEDIYVYIDPIDLISDIKTGSSFTFNNSCLNDIGNFGSLTITVDSGSFTELSIDIGYDNLTVTESITAGDILIIDFNNKKFMLNGTMIFVDKILDIKDDSTTNINVTLTGSGSATAEYSYLAAVNNENDLLYCESLEMAQGYEVIRKLDVQGNIKIKKVAKSEQTWSINGLWNKFELDKFNSSEMFRLRFIDEEGSEVEILANCVISNINKTSSTTSDYTYTVSGVCQKAF